MNKIKTRVGQHIAMTANALICVAWMVGAEAIWQLICAFVASCFMVSYWVDECVRISRARQQRTGLDLQRRQVLALVMQLGCGGSTGLTPEEIDDYLSGRQTEEDLIARLRSHRDILWSHARTDCKFFAGVSSMKCAVNPTTPCNICPHFQAIAEDTTKP
jgi:hypothetical protein